MVPTTLDRLSMPPASSLAYFIKFRRRHLDEPRPGRKGDPQPTVIVLDGLLVSVAR